MWMQRKDGLGREAGRKRTWAPSGGYRRRPGKITFDEENGRYPWSQISFHRKVVIPAFSSSLGLMCSLWLTRAFLAHQSGGVKWIRHGPSEAIKHCQFSKLLSSSGKGCPRPSHQFSPHPLPCQDLRSFPMQAHLHLWPGLSGSCLARRLSSFCSLSLLLCCGFLPLPLWISSKT